MLLMRLCPYVRLTDRCHSHPGLGTSMTHHVRRLLLTPLPAFEGEMAARGGDVPPAVAAASKCLAICIEVSTHIPMYIPNCLNTE